MQQQVSELEGARASESARVSSLEQEVESLRASAESSSVGVRELEAQLADARRQRDELAQAAEEAKGACGCCCSSRQVLSRANWSLSVSRSAFARVQRWPTARRRRASRCVLVTLALCA